MTEPAPDLPACDPDVFRNGRGVVSFHARSAVVEPWVRKVRELSGQKVDWHVSGGYASVLYVGDREKVLRAVEELKPELEAACLKSRDEGWGDELQAWRVSDRALYRNLDGDDDEP